MHKNDIILHIILYFSGYHSSTAPEDFFKKKYKRIEAFILFYMLSAFNFFCNFEE